MRIFLIILSLTLVQPDSLSFLFWNLENFFDPRPDSTSASELAFSAFGERHWSRKRYDRKVGMVGKTILWSAARYGSQPAIMGFAELEKKRADYSKQIAEKNSKIVSVQKSMKGASASSIISKQSQINSLNEEISKLQTKIADVEKRIAGKIHFSLLYVVKIIFY